MDFVIFLFVALFSLAALVFFAICIIWFYLAPNNYFFTFVNEGTAKVVVRGKKFKKCLMAWKGRTFDDEWNVVDGKDNSFWDYFGGLRWVGLYPFDKIYAYKFRWTTLDNEGNLEAHGERWQDYVLLGDDYYAFKIEKAEDKNSIPLDFTMVATIAPLNPYRMLFNVENWLESVIVRIGPAIRDIIGEYSFEEMVADKGATDENKFELDRTFTERLKDRNIFEDLKVYGAEIKFLQAKEIDPPDAYRSVTLTKRTKEYEAEGINVLADAEAGRVKKIYAAITGFGEDGKFIRAFEAAEKSPLASSLIVVPGLSQMVDKVISAKGGSKNVKRKENKKEAA
jgi:hypothetical protein